MRCNHCGAPLEVRSSAKFVTCGYCNAQLAIHHTGNAYSTELIQQLEQTTKTLVRDVDQIKNNARLEQLDRKWELERKQFTGNSDGGEVEFQPHHRFMLVGCSGFMLLFSVFWTVSAMSMFPPMGIFGLLFMGMVIFGVVTSWKKMDEYEAKRNQYQKRRRKLLGEIQKSGS